MQGLENNYVFKAYVNKVTDGDTIHAELFLAFGIRFQTSLRFARINTMELNSKVLEEREKAFEAKAFVYEKLMDKFVTIASSKPDKYGRYLAEVFYEENGEVINLNDKLIDLGLAKAY